MIPRPAVTHPDAELMMKAQAVKGRSLLADARRRLFRNKAAVLGMIVLAFIASMALFAPFLSPYAFSDIDYNVISCAPDWWPGDALACRAGGQHWFGTDAVGRDLFIRVLHGGRIVELGASEWAAAGADARATGQFNIADERSAREVADLIRQLGYEPVWKDWDAALA